MKPCIKCGATERDANGDCSVCHRARTAKRKKEHPEIVAADNAKYYASHKEQHLAGSRRRYLRNPEKKRKASRKGQRARAGWAPGEHEKAEAAFPFVTKCACCPNTSPRNKRGWAADHNHETGMFRGHVCLPCNVVIGYIESGWYRVQDHPVQQAYLLDNPPTF